MTLPQHLETDQFGGVDSWQNKMLAAYHQSNPAQREWHVRTAQDTGRSHHTMLCYVDGAYVIGFKIDADTEILPFSL